MDLLREDRGQVIASESSGFDCWILVRGIIDRNS